MPVPMPRDVHPGADRQSDQLAALILDLVAQGGPMLTNRGLLKKMKDRFNGRWHTATEETVSASMAVLRRKGFCTVETLDERRVGNEARPRVLTLWDGRHTAKPQPPASDRDIGADLRDQIEARSAAGAVQRIIPPVPTVPAAGVPAFPWKS